METLIADVKSGLRSMARSPQVAVAALAALAIGIGANTAVFSVVNAVLLAPLPYPDGERIVRVRQSNLKTGDGGPMASAIFNILRERSRTLEHLASSRDAMFTFTTPDGDAEQLMVYRFDPEMWKVYGVQPRLGRVLTAQDDRPGDRTVVLTEQFWRRRLDGDPAIVGKTITLDGAPALVVGVMPKAFRVPQHVEAWTSMQTPPQNANSFTARFVRAGARMRPGVTIRDVQRELDGIAALIRKEHPQVGEHLGFQVTTRRQEMSGDVKPALLMLLGAVGFVLLVACTDVASLLLARAAARRTEFAVRAALGASRGRLVRQLVTESSLLAIAGALLGVLITVWSVGPLLTLFPQNQQNLSIPRLDEIPIDGPVLLFAAAMAVVCTLLAGLLPAISASRFGLRDALAEAAGPGQKSARLRSMLLVAEIAAAVVLLAGAGLLTRSLLHILHTDLGFDPRGVATGRLMLTGDKFTKDEQRRAFAAELERRLKGAPGVEAVGLASFLPLSGWWGATELWADGTARPATGESMLAHHRAVTPGWHGTVRSPLIAGRTFTEADGPNAPRVAVVTESLVKRLWPDAKPAGAVGRRVRMPGDRPQDPDVVLEVAGVIRDVRQLDPAEPAAPEVQVPYAQAPFQFIGVALRTTAGVSEGLSLLKRTARELDATRAVSFSLAYEDIASDILAPRRVTATLVVILAGLALGLAALGIYGLLSYAVVVRTREIGVRVALGASTSDVTRLFLRGGLRLAGLGLLIGLALALALGRVIAALLVGIKPADPVTLAAVIGVLFAVALMASILPARRAARLAPTAALRS